ncbi:MaoC family dehydratase [Streptomyces sp. NPDC008343]|uniref:MaoC family dehydratase n=1 Tax=Streptomyces sp. NPDC008343 TaxID=3364828 RepID=UPI0036ED532B
MRVFTDLDRLEAAVGEPLGVSSWHDVSQERVLAFADATGDFNWLHTSPERAAATAFGSTIAHGYLTLALTSAFAEEMYRLDGVAMRINYGLDKVRFVRAVPVGARVRGRGVLRRVDRRPGAALVAITMTVETEQPAEVVCVAETLTYVTE